MNFPLANPIFKDFYLQNRSRKGRDICCLTYFLFFGKKTLTVITNATHSLISKFQENKFLHMEKDKHIA